MKTHTEKKSSGSMAKDPVCGMDVDMQNPGAKLSGQGKDQYFCSSECRDKFQQQQGGQGQQSQGGNINQDVQQRRHGGGGGKARH